MTRPSPEPPQPSLDNEMFFPDDRDDDHRWDPTADDEDNEDLLLWDANGSNVSFFLFWIENIVVYIDVVFRRLRMGSIRCG